jgi:phosphoglycerol transferase
VGEYGLLSLVTTALVAVMARPWVGGWSTPIVAGNDTLSHFAMMRDTGWTGTARGPQGLAAGGSLDWSDFPLGPDRVHLVLYRVLRLVTGDAMVAFNLYLLAGFLLVAWAAYAVLRVWRISPLVAGALSVAFTLAPYHFARLSDGHVFLAAYFSVPLGVLLAVWASDGSLAGRGFAGFAGARRGADRHDRRRLLATAACVAIVGSSSAYYGVFAVVLIVSLALVTAVRRRSWRTLVVPAVLAAAVLGVIALNVAGDLWSARAEGANHEVSVRPTSDSDTYGLRLSQALLPDPAHRVDALGALGRQARQVQVPGEDGSTLGLLAVAGLAAVALGCVRRVGRARDAQDVLVLRLGVLAAAAVAVATVSGLGLVVAVAGFGQIRVWSRMSIVLAFLGLAGLAVVVDRWCASPRVRAWSFGPLLVAVGIVAIAMVDQTSPGSLPDRATTAQERAVDEQIAAEMEAALPAGAHVYQLPQTDFLFDVPDGEMPLYGLLGPWSTGGDLDYSAGSLQGRGGDWQRSWAMQPPEVLVAGAAAAGFDALYLDRRSELGSVTDGSGSEGTADEAAWLRETWGAPDGSVQGEGSVQAEDDRRDWYDLRPAREQLIEQLGAARVEQLGAAVRRPIGVVYEGAVDRFAVAGGARLVQAESAITLRDEWFGTDGGPDGPLLVRFELTGEPGARVRIQAAGAEQVVELDGGSAQVELEVPVRARDTVIHLSTDAPRLAGVAGRHGDVRLQVSQLQVIDADLDEAVRSGELTLR